MRERPRNNDIVGDLENWWRTCPFFTRYYFWIIEFIVRNLIYICLILSIPSFFSRSIADALMNIPSRLLGAESTNHFLLFNQLVYRIFTSPFVFVRPLEVFSLVFQVINISCCLDSSHFSPFVPLMKKTSGQ